MSKRLRTFGYNLLRLARFLPVDHDASGRMVFLIGNGRSGTTMLARYLRRHPDIRRFPTEANHIWHPGIYPWHKSKIDIPPYWLDPVRYTEHSVAYHENGRIQALRRPFSAYAILNSRRTILVKTVMANFMIPLLNRAFPDARFIHLFRDGRAVARSFVLKEAEKIRRQKAFAKLNLDLSENAMLFHQGKLWKETEKSIELADEALSLSERKKLIKISYEKFCESPRQELDRILEFCGVAPERGNAIDLSDVYPTNHKFREALSPDILEQLEQTLSPLLEMRGYK